MIVYSKKIIKFIHEIKSAVKTILSREIGLKVAGERFYDFMQSSSYPLVVVVYNNKSMLGYFDCDFYELGFHECLMHANREQLLNIIRHELAHYMDFIIHGPHLPPHGTEFRNFCQRVGWGEEVYRSTFCLGGGENTPLQDASAVLRKVQKLLALSTSSNPHEAEQAMIKSQQLLLKHNIDVHSIEREDDEKIFLKRIMKQKKENAKMRSIGKILETFFVNTVYSRAGDYTYLEIVGSAVNLEIAEYVADFLNRELDKQWEAARKEYEHLKGMIAKNSFFEGIARGYCLKIQSLKREYSAEVSHSLMVIEKKLIDAKTMVYPRLHSVKRSGSGCRLSSAVGEQIGRQLNINPALHKAPKHSNVLISY